MYYKLCKTRRGVSAVLLSAAVLLAFGSSLARADSTDCKRTIAKASATFERTKLKALQSCEDSKRKGKLPATTDCLIEAKAAKKIAKAQTALSDKIGKSCSGQTLTEIGWDGSGNNGNPVLAKACTGGKRPGNLCGRETECPGICVGGGKNDESCTYNSSCANKACAKANCIGGTHDGQPCNDDASATTCESGGGTCPLGAGCDGGSSGNLGTCLGGPTPNISCFADSDCGSGGKCDAGCNTGSLLDCQAGLCDGALCTSDNDCRVCADGLPNQHQTCSADSSCGKICQQGTGDTAKVGLPCKTTADCDTGNTCDYRAGGCAAAAGSCSGGFCSASSSLGQTGYARVSPGICLPTDRCPNFENNLSLAVKSCDGGGAGKNGAFCSSDADCGTGKCKSGCDFALSTTADVASCLTCIGEASVDQINSAVYGKLKPVTYSCVGGANEMLPCTPATASTDCPGGKCKMPADDKALEKCKSAIGKATAKFFDKKRDLLAKCEDAAIKAGSGTCPNTETSDKIKEATDKMLSSIAVACAGNDKLFGGDSSGNLDFAPDAIGNLFDCANFTAPYGGPACAGVSGRGPITSLQDLASCLQCITEFKADCTDRIAAPQVGSTAQPLIAACNPLCGNGKLDGHCSVTTATTCGSTLDCPTGEQCRPDETCDDGNAVSGDACPSNCKINACTLSETTRLMAVSFTPPPGVTLSALAVYVEYPDGTVAIPGTANDAQVTASLTVPFDAFSSINDLDYAVRITLIGNNSAMFPQVAAAVQMAQCQGASDPTNDQFRCFVESAADTNGNTVSGVSCSATVF